MSMHIEGRDFEDGPNEVKSGRQGPPIGLIAFGIVTIVTVLFVLQNRERTDIDFLFFELRSRTWFAIAISIALGVLLDRLFLLWWRRRRKRNKNS